MLGVVNAILGTATLLSFDSEAPKSDGEESSVQLAPTVAAAENGATIGVVGRF